MLCYEHVPPCAQRHEEEDVCPLRLPCPVIESNIVRTSCTDSVHRVERQYLSQRVHGVVLFSLQILYLLVKRGLLIVHRALNTFCSAFIPILAGFETAFPCYTVLTTVHASYAKLYFDACGDLKIAEMFSHCMRKTNLAH